ncbi:hypothetical protein SMD11_5065 [Streptomyces albireticuli]|uniref:Uncharacterized protein n=1 Tax=Streptomyces albireticuli TaxID=1940 RepID=A0A1Z2L8M8_9ACTN|nr:hypothetical protein [Streptomyces albireticuli]ARZ70657.1 hypothetical protein SMD11_5065 [Streptomyces albireticuli]
MTLRVQPGELEKFAGQLRRAADDAYDMLAHADRYTKVSLVQGACRGWWSGSTRTYGKPCSARCDTSPTS